MTCLDLKIVKWRLISILIGILSHAHEIKSQQKLILSEPVDAKLFEN
jgi:hypothetical protein